MRNLPPSDYSSPDSTTRSVGNISLSLLSASEAILRRKSFHPKASPWFNEKVNDAINLMRSARQRHKVVSAPLPSPDIPSFLEFKRARREVKRTVTKAKRDWALSFTGSVAPEDVWRLTSWSKGVRRQRIPTLNDPLGGQAITSSTKQDLFFRSFFPPPPSLDGTPIVDPDEDNPNTRPFTEVTTEEVRKALSSCLNTSAPGPSGVGYKALKWLWDSSPKLLTEALGACLHHGIHHPDWKKAITVILTKPNKPSYADPRAYRPIQLLECFGKLLEKIVAARLAFDIGRLDLVPCEQFGGRTASSCLDAGLSLVHDVQTGWKKGLVSSMLAIDVKGFFDHVNHDRLIYIIWRMGFPLQLVKWVKSFLTGRSASLRMDGEYSDDRPINIGIPQGSPCSPVLSIIYSSEVLEFVLFHENLHSSKGVPVAPKAYVDDFNITAFSPTLQENVEILARVLVLVVQKLKEIGMSIDLSKLELQHFTRRQGDNLRPPLRASLPSGPIVVTPPKVLRWLGFYLDCHLSFREHVKIMAARSSSIIVGLRCLGNTVRGLSQSNMRVLYKTCVFPVLSYGAPLWFREGARQKTLIKIMDTVQNKALRMIAGMFRTSPIHALQCLSHVPPVTHSLRRLSESAAIRFLKLPALSPVIQRLPNDWRGGKRPTSHTPFSTPHSLLYTNPNKQSIIQHLASSVPTNSEKLDPFTADAAPWHRTPDSMAGRFTSTPNPPPPDKVTSLVAEINRTHIAARHDPSLLLVYCDGSRKPDADGDNRSGYGAVFFNCGIPITSFSVGLGEHASVFDAEMHALAHASTKVKRLMDGQILIQNVTFFSDSVSALLQITNPSAHPSQLPSLLFRDTCFSLLLRFPLLKITLKWSPGHLGIIGNTLADDLAKKGTSLPPQLLLLLRVEDGFQNQHTTAVV